MFVLSTLVYPSVLALLCIGTGLLVDRAGGGFLHPALLPAVGAAGLIGLSQLSTYPSWLAPATPVLMAVVSLAGFAVCRGRALALSRTILQRPWPVAAMVLAYLLALAPVLLSGRPTFSSFMALSDSAVHMIGADYLITHGQQYGHLDLHNSYGQFINAYYNTSYPSGADTLLGGSAFLLGLPIIWVFEPLNAFVLACAIGPAWVLARRVGLGMRTSAVAAVTCVLPALVYGYVLIGSVKELAALAMILTMGALLAGHRNWLGLAPRRSIPIGLVVAAGVSSLGVGFGVWALMAALVLASILVAEVISRAVAPARAAAAAGGGGGDDPPRRAAHMGERGRLAEGREHHRVHQQPREPARTPPADPASRRLAVRQLQDRSAGRLAHRHPHPRPPDARLCGDRCRVADPHHGRMRSRAGSR